MRHHHKPRHPPLHHLVLAFAVVCATHGALPAQEGSPYDRLMERSGLVVQLGQVAPGILQELDADDESPMPIDEQALDRLRQAVTAAFAGERLVAGVREHLEQELAAEDVEEVLRWLDSPLGRRITAMEEAASRPEVQLRHEADRDEILADLGVDRRRTLEALDRAVGATEASVTIAIETMLATAEGVALVAPEDSKPVLELIRRQVEASRPAIEAMIRDETLLASAAAYQDLSDADLERYVEFASSPAAKRYHGVTTDGIAIALRKAARQLGMTLGGSSREA